MGVLSGDKATCAAMPVVRGCNDYGLFGKWTDGGVFFVTRLKENAAHAVAEAAMGPLPRNIPADGTIRFTDSKAIEKCPHPLRRVAVWDGVNEREIVPSTNPMHFGPTTIAAIYKDRREIELFSKALKQSLKVKSFVGTSRNALMIQIWTALTAMLRLKWMRHLSKAKWSFSNLASHAADEPVHLPGSAAVAGGSLRHPADCPPVGTA